MTTGVSIAQRLSDHVRRSLPQRLRATAIHFGISMVIFVVAMYLILAHWYPGFHFTVDGGWQGVRIMVAVDLVLGPTLTLLIFNPFKARRLIVFDLTCIGLTQLGALAWGFYAIHSQRPVSVNFSDGEFYSMTAEPMKMEKYPLSLLDELSNRTPALIYVAPPQNEDEEARIAMLEFISGIAAHEDPLRFRAFAPHWATVEEAAVDVDKQAESQSWLAHDLEAFLVGHGGTTANYRFFPYTGRYGTCTAIFGAEGEYHGALGCRGF